MPDWTAAPYDEYQPDNEYQPEEASTPSYTTHPALGIISFVLSILTVTFFVVMIALAAVYAGPNGKPPKESPLVILVGLGICSAPVLALVGLGLGIGSLFQRGSKVFGILGVVFNAMLLLGSILFLLIALIAASAANPPAAGAGPQACGDLKDTFCARAVDPLLS